MINYEDIPERPPINGLCFRPFSGVSDAGALHAIHASCAEWDGVDPLSSTERRWSREEYETSLAALEEAGGPERTILAEIDGRAVAYNRFFDWTESDGTRVWLIVGSVLPEWRGRGLGTALLRWSEVRVRELAAEGGQGAEERESSGAANFLRWEYAANASSTETEATALLRDNDYRAAYTVLEMGLDWDAFVPLTAYPTGIDIRVGRAEDAARIADSVDDSYRDEYPGGRYAEQFDPPAYASELAGAGYDPALWRVAWDGDKVIGQVIPLIERGRAEIDEVSVRPGWRRRGVARALLADALLGLRAAQIETVRLHTVREFPTQAHRLYSSLGFRVLKEFPRYRKAA